jgi:hypothetical protein
MTNRIIPAGAGNTLAGTARACSGKIGSSKLPTFIANIPDSCNNKVSTLQQPDSTGFLLHSKAVLEKPI